MTTTEGEDRAGSPWLVKADGWDPEKITHHGNLFLLGNGSMGYRGTLEEFGPEERVGILLPGLYDQVGDAWREPVNAPNGLFTRVSVNGKSLNPLQLEPVAHEQQLDMRTAVHRRSTTWAIEGATISVTAERFLSADQVNLMALRYVIKVDGAAELLLESGIDHRIWDLNGPHLENICTGLEGSALTLEARTHERGYPVAVAASAALGSTVDAIAKSHDGSMRRWAVTVKDSATIELSACAAVCSSLDGADEPPVARAARIAAEAGDAGYAALLEAHIGVWEERWQRADVIIDGDPAGQHALRYSIYQLLSAAPFHSEHLSIPARALSGQVYKGAIFWDTEVFMFPFFLAAFPEVARNLVRYRIHTLAGARNKAAEYGYGGAFYAWEGQDGGHDACTLFNITDVFTNRPMRTYFRDKQIHISADVAWAMWQYVETTGDLETLWEGGLEVMLECARFFLSYAYRDSRDRQFVLVDVTGPDEYHERVGNNAYTNYLVQYAVDATMKAARLLEATDPERFASLCRDLQLDEAEAAALRDFAERLYLPSPDEQTGVIEQFDGYFKLEDCSLSSLKDRVLNPNEYLGGGSGLATTTQILKQADVVLLLHLLGERFTTAQKRANWDFYEPRTEHGSSLSACAYALVAAGTGKLDFAYKYFLKTATIDLHGKSKQFVGTLYIGGTHPAANGGAWMVAVQGFAGFQLTPGGIRIQPSLPGSWKQLAFPFSWRGNQGSVTVTPDQVLIQADPANPQPVPVACGQNTSPCHPGQSISLAYP